MFPFKERKVIIQSFSKLIHLISLEVEDIFIKRKYFKEYCEFFYSLTTEHEHNNTGVT